METLNIEHIAPYLTFGISFMMLSENHCPEPNIDVLKSIDTVLGMVNFGHGNAKELTEIKPILRPLSDLNKWGSDGVEINEHTINVLMGDKGCYGNIIFSHYKGELDLTVESDLDQGYDSSKHIDFDVFEKVRNELLKGHYDIFGLIEKGLAIDINQIKE